MNGCPRSIAHGYRWSCLHCKPFLFPFKWKLLQATPDSLRNTHENSRGGDAVQETQPHFPSKSMPPSRKRQHSTAGPTQAPLPCVALHADCCPAGPPTLTPRKTLGNVGMATCFISGHLAALRDQHKAASYFDILLQAACSSLCHPFPPDYAVSAWSWHLWFLRSQPWHCRTREHLAGVSNLLPLTTLSSRYSANWATTCPCSFRVSRLSLISVCKYFPSHPPTSSPAELRSFHEISGIYLPKPRARRKTFRKLLLSAKACSWPNSSSK